MNAITSKQLDGKTAVVTGAGSGIGQAIAVMFAAEGARVVLAGRGMDKLQKTAMQIEAAGGTALCLPTDITSEQSVAKLFEGAVSHFGKVDVLVNNAGDSKGGNTDTLSLADWKAVIDVNLTGAFLCSREAFRLMKAQRAGRIINVGSTAAKVPRARSAPYAASKFGLDGFTRALAIEAREFGVAVSIVHPGNTLPGLWTGREHLVKNEGLMDASSVARVALLMAALPPDVNLYESTVLPVSMPFLGRG